MHKLSWVALPAFALVCATHGYAQFQLSQTPTGTLLSSGSTAFHSTSARVLDWSTFAIESSDAQIASWGESDEQGVLRRYFAIEPAGSDRVVVRETSYEIGLRRASFDPAQGAPDFADSPFAAQGHVHLVQYSTQPLLEYAQAIESAGGEVFDFIERHSHIVRGSDDALARIRALPFVRATTPYHPEFRVDPELSDALRAGSLGPAQRYHIQVFRRGLEEQRAVAQRITELGGSVELLVPEGFRLDATLTPEMLVQVAALDQVRFIDRWSAPQDDMDIVRSLGGANHLETLAGFTGQGVRVEVLDGGCDVAHPDFAAPISHGSVPSGTHGTCTSGIVAGTGANNPQARGMLPSAKLVAGYYGSYSGGNRYTHTAELVNSSLTYQCVLQSNSWGSSWVTDYTSTSAEMDDIILQNDFLILQSQSNSNSTQSRPEAWAKNVVSIGGINHQDNTNYADDSWGGASIGPASDGRMKPDLAYFYDSILCNDVQGGGGYAGGNYYTGFGGTSAATPISAGHFGLFFQMWHAGVFGNAPGTGSVFQSRPHFTLAKAAMMNTATPWNFSGSTHNLSRAKQGLGHANVKTLYDRRDKTFFVNQTDIVSNLSSVTYNLNVNGGEPDLRVTLVYRDAMGAVSSSQHRKNDLTLVVTSPGGTIYFGNNGLTNGLWSTAGGSANTKDTVESVFVQSPASGTWVVEVRGDNVNTNPLTNTPSSTTDFALWATGVTQGPVCPQPSAYCTAKLTSQFTLPQIGFSGVPSVATNNFHLKLTDALPNKSAIAFFGPLSHSGPFHHGVLCTKAPITRSPILQTDAASAADLAIPVTPAMVGTTRYYQWWFRDPQDAFSDGLSNGLEVEFCD